MKIPFTVNRNFFKEYEPSDPALELVQDSKRRIKSENFTWDESYPPRLTELAIMALVANFENHIVLHKIPCWDKDHLLESLPTNLPLPLVVKYVHDDIYWERRVKDRWKGEENNCEDYGNNWKRMFLEKHVQEAVEAMTPEGFDLADVAALCKLTKNYVKNLDLRQLQIMRFRVQEEDEEDEGNEEKFSILPEPNDHINLAPIITGLENLIELHVQIGLRNIGSDYKKSLFDFSLQDCRNLGSGVAQAQNLRLLRVHDCKLDDDRLIALLSSMEDNESLETIDFSNCIIGDDGATAIAKYIKNRSNIKHINLSNNKIGEEGISALAFMITRPYASPIESLNLKFNAFGDAGLKYLASALIRENTRIHSLKLSCCGLGDESGIYLGEVLNRNTVIINLDLSNNHLGEKSGGALEAALENNQTIEYLDVRMTELPNENLININKALHLNRIRAIKGEKGVERELILMKKRSEEERLKQEELSEATKVVTEEEVTTEIIDPN